MLPITLPEDITPSEKKSLIFASIESESSLITVPVSKVSSSSTQSVEVPDQDSDPSFLKDCQLTMVKNPSWVSPSTHLPKFQPLLLNPTTPFFPPIPFLNILMSVSCSTMKLSMISAEETSISKDPPTLT